MFVFAFVFVFALVLACVGDVGEGKLIVEEKEDGILYLDVVAVAGEGDDETEDPTNIQPKSCTRASARVAPARANHAG